MPRIKRKPPPSMDFDARYPSPDPSDPFAPLWVLRNRSSNLSLALGHSNDNLQSIHRTSSYDLYPSLLPFTDTHKFIVPDVVLSNDKKSHYRRRSHSTPLTQLVPPLTFPSIHSSPLTYSHSEHNQTPPVPSLLTDNTSESSISGTDAEAMLTPVGESTPGKLARLLLPKKTRSSSLDKYTPSTPSRIGKISISSPIGFEHVAGSGRMLNDQATRSTNDLHSPQPHCIPLRRPATSDAPSPPRELDGYHSQPEILPIHRRARSPLSNSHTVDLLALPSPSTSSHSSSYAQTPDPPSSIANSSSAGHSNLSRPRTAPHLATSSSSSPSRQGYPHRQSKSRAENSQVPPGLRLPIQTEWTTPSPSQLAYAASLPIIAESGIRVTFGSIFATQRTVVIFIRHFWCPLCQDYMTSLTSLAHPDMMYTTSPSSSVFQDTGKTERVQLVVISNGSQAFIPKYRQIFDMPFSMYTDPSLALYAALGMGRDGVKKVSSAVPLRGMCRDEHHTKEGIIERDEEREVVLDGGYVQHGLVSGIAMVVGRALKAGMPVWERGGDIAQLGGEFVFGPGLTCSYAHRMQSVKGHAPIRDVLRAAGVNPWTPEPDTPATSTSDSYFSALRGVEVGSRNQTKKRRNTMQDFGARVAARKRTVDSGSSGAITDDVRRSQARMSSQEQTGWMLERAKSFEILRQKKHLRRGVHLGDAANGEFCLSGSSSCSPVVEEDTL